MCYMLCSYTAQGQPAMQFNTWRVVNTWSRQRRWKDKTIPASSVHTVEVTAAIINSIASELKGQEVICSSNARTVHQRTGQLI